MQNIRQVISRFSSVSLSSGTDAARFLKGKTPPSVVNGARFFSGNSGGGDGNEGRNEWDNVAGRSFGATGSDDFGWDSVSSWSTGMAKNHFDGDLVVGKKVDSSSNVVGRVNAEEAARVSTWKQEMEDDDGDFDKELEEIAASHARECRDFKDKWDDRMRETSVLLKQVREPGARGSYLKDSEKAEMYRLHKENPEVYTIEKLAKDYRIMRQRVHAILWLKQIEEEEEKKLGHPLDDSVELLLDTCPEFFISHDREFHVASLPYKPDFKVMPEGWDGTIKDPDEVHYEISMKEDEMLYQEFVQKMNFNKMKFAGQVKHHKYSRRRPSQGWNYTVEKMGAKGKRGGGGGWKFVSLPDGSSRPLNETEKMYVKRETPRHRRKILP